LLTDQAAETHRCDVQDVVSSRIVVATMSLRLELLAEPAD
jgi:hypothetical protein